ncbi:hypothetical protein PQR15_34320 [Streptomyces lydicus]|nr:hypothetical protein [Streptomyces lydicus]
MRGYRVELGEVEAALADCPGVLESVVLPHTQGGVGVLAACLRTAPGTSLEQVRAHAALRLPEWMRPSAYRVVAAMPLTPAGKIDRVALGAGWAPVRTDQPTRRPGRSLGPRGAGRLRRGVERAPYHRSTSRRAR